MRHQRHGRDFLGGPPNLFLRAAKTAPAALRTSFASMSTWTPEVVVSFMGPSYSSSMNHP